MENKSDSNVKSHSTKRQPIILHLGKAEQEGIGGGYFRKSLFKNWGTFESSYLQTLCGRKTDEYGLSYQDSYRELNCRREQETYKYLM